MRFPYTVGAGAGWKCGAVEPGGASIFVVSAQVMTGPGRGLGRLEGIFLESPSLASESSFHIQPWVPSLHFLFWGDAYCLTFMP